MGINWKHRKVIVSIVMCVLLCVTAITAMMYTAFGAGSSNIKNVNAIQVYSNDKAGSADTSEGTDTTGNMDKAGSTDTTGNADTPGVSKLAASDNVLEGYCTFYDYVVAPYKGNVYGWGYKEYPKRSINTSSNYADNGKPKLTVGTIDQNFRANQHNCYVNGLNVNTCIYYNGGIKTTGSFSGVKKDYMNASQGIIYGLDKENYKNVLFNVDEPGLFSDDKKTGKTIYNNYKLTFDKQDNGNDSSTYTLKSVTSPSGDVTLAGDNFFPLNNADSNVLDCGYNAADGQKGTNYYFGMRYDISFSLNGYTGDLLYKFTGDDDLWVFVDGELVLDLGGIHPECGGDVDLWQTGPIARELQTVASRDKVNMSTNHTITVLYMERGGNASNCNMKFIVPNSARIDIADSGNLNFKKIDDRGNGLANAVFGITSKDNKENALAKTSVSDKNGIVSFDNLPVGKYILKEITAPDGYTGSDEEYNVEVVLDENDSSTAIATLTDNSGNVIAVTRTKVQYIDGKKSYAVENVFNSSIVNTRNVSIEDFIVDKQVRVEDWDNRTYKINLMTGISNNNGSYAEGDVINNVIIRDYIDSRFDIIADNNEIVTADKAADQPYSVNGGNIKYDKERNLLYVEWDNQSVQYSDSKLYTWEKSIFVKAKDNYIGGNNVTTNASASGVIINGGIKEFDTPTVNVKVNGTLKCRENVIFYGENITSADYEMSEMFKLNGNIREDGNALTEQDYYTEWYEDNNGALGSVITKADVINRINSNASTGSDSVYYVKGFYNVTPVSNSDECTINTDGHIASGIIYNNDEPGDHYGSDCACYRIKVVKGQLDITKYIDEQYIDNKVIRANQTFIFRIEQYGVVNEDNTENKGALEAVFYATASFDANGDVLSATSTVTGLKKGFYSVIEEESWTPEYTLIKKSDNYSGNDSYKECEDIFIGKRIDGTKPEFFGLDKLHYGNIADGDKAQADFSNVIKKNYNWLRDAASAVNKFIR